MKNIREGGCFAFCWNDKKIGVIPDAAKRRSGLRRQDAEANIGEANGPKGEPQEAASSPATSDGHNRPYQSHWVPAFAGMTKNRNDENVGVIPDAAKRRSGTQRLRTGTIDRTKVTEFRLSPE